MNGEHTGHNLIGLIKSICFFCSFVLSLFLGGLGGGVRYFFYFYVSVLCVGLGCLNVGHNGSDVGSGGVGGWEILELLCSTLVCFFASLLLFSYPLYAASSFCPVSSFLRRKWD